MKHDLDSKDNPLEIKLFILCRLLGDEC
jgi:hypothetical protein